MARENRPPEDEAAEERTEDARANGPRADDHAAHPHGPTSQGVTDESPAGPDAGPDDRYESPAEQEFEPEDVPPEQQHLFDYTAVAGIPMTGGAFDTLSDVSGGTSSGTVSGYEPPEGYTPPESPTAANTQVTETAPGSSGSGNGSSTATSPGATAISAYQVPESVATGSTTGEHRIVTSSQETTGAQTPSTGMPLNPTPSGGMPVMRLTAGARGQRPWQERMRVLLRTPMSERHSQERGAERTDEGLSVPRVLDVTLRIGELLLASGESAEDVEAAMLGVTHAFGLERCEPTVTFTLLSISYHPSLVESPVTAERVVRRRGSDFTRLAAVYQLVDDVTNDSEGVTVEEVYRRLADIRRNRHPYPGWMLTLASGLLSASASVLVGGDLLVFGIAFIASMLGDRLAWVLANRGLPEFYQYVLAAVPSAALASALAAFQVQLGWQPQASAVITGGLFALIPGRPLVAAVQDGLTGFYITAAARLLEVFYLFVGIVCGISMTLYLAVQVLEVPLLGKVDNAPPSSDRPIIQIAAAAGLTLAFCVLLQTERVVVLVAVANGTAAWVTYAALRERAELAGVVSTAIAAIVLGLFGQLMARYRSSSALPYMIPALGPLIPGSALYYGLLGITLGHMDSGLLSTARSGALALALAVGVNLGGELARLFLPAVHMEGVPEKRRAAKRTRGF